MARAFVSVRQKHIDAGMRQMGQCCPIALAIREQYCIASVDIMVSRDRAYIHGGVYKMPDSAIDFVRKFDDKQFVKPFVFSINLK